MPYEPDEKIILSGFELEPAEKSIVGNLVKNYQSKIKRRIGNYKEIKINMDKSKKGKEFLHEVHGNLRVAEDSKIKGKKLFSANATEYNLFSALSEVFEKLMKEAIHKKRDREGDKRKRK